MSWGKKIYIDKDFTTEVQNKRYFLRQFAKKLKNADGSLKVRMGDHRIFINDKPFTCSGENIVAFKKMDADFLHTILEKASMEYAILLNTTDEPRADQMNGFSNKLQ